MTAATLSDPKGRAVAITPDDSNDLSTACTSIYVGGAGNVKVDTTGGDTVTFNGATAGSVLPIRCTRVYSTGTTATNLLALYDD